MSGALPGIRPSSARKRVATLEAAQTVFLRDGFATASVDEVADRSGVSKQTIYAHFGSKETLFVAMVTRMTSGAADRVRARVDLADPADVGDLRPYLERWGRLLLDVVLEPDLLALRRLVIGEVGRFPDLARAFWDSGPAGTMAAMRERFSELDRRGRLAVDDPEVAGRSFNWLVTSHPLNAAMLLGDAAVPRGAERRRIATEATRVFLAAYGVPG